MVVEPTILGFIADCWMFLGLALVISVIPGAIIVALSDTLARRSVSSDCKDSPSDPYAYKYTDLGDKPVRGVLLDVDYDCHYRFFYLPSTGRLVKFNGPFQNNEGDDWQMAIGMEELCDPVLLPCEMTDLGFALINLAQEFEHPEGFTRA